ncbi:MAG: glutaminyl-peptide cyclotransferase, partial [Crocinitomicaceae bacterium]
IYANIYQSDFIVVIDPKTGKVLQQISATQLAKISRGDGDVLNGIAYNPETQKMIVTGKFWKEYHEVKVTPVK